LSTNTAADWNRGRDETDLKSVPSRPSPAHTFIFSDTTIKRVVGTQEETNSLNEFSYKNFKFALSFTQVTITQNKNIITTFEDSLKNAGTAF
jgi:hypothetical protein